MKRRRLALSALVLSILLAGCVGGATPERSVETVEFTLSTPTPETPAPPQPVTVRFLGPDAGATAVITDGRGRALVVDAGSDPNATALRRVLSRTDVGSYDLWLTGLGEARLAGAPALFQHRPPDNIGFSGLTANTSLYNRFLRAAVDAERQYRLYRSTAPFAYSPSVGTVGVLSPPSAYLGDSDPPANEVVLAYTGNGQRVLWLGTPGRLEERWLLNDSESDLGADVLVLQAGATPSDRLLAAVGPEAVVIQGRSGVERTASRVENRTGTLYALSRQGPLTLSLGPNETRVATGTLQTPQPSAATTSGPPASPSPNVTTTTD